MLGGLPGKTLVLLACLLSVADGFSSVPSGVALGAASSRLSLSCGSHKASNGVVHGLGGLVMSGQEGGANMERRSFIGLAGLAAGVSLSAPSASNADMAPMGSDVLDRPEFRKRQDLVIEKLFEPEGGPSTLMIPYNGRNKKLKKMLGEKATIVMNIKLDDPETSRQIPALKTLVGLYAEKGLSAICMPTDQGDYEPDDSTTIRIKVQQQFGMPSSSKGPIVVADKADIVGKFSHPYFKYLTTNLVNPNNVTRITLNYEKFLVDAEGKVLRRYPRMWGADLMEKDVKAVIEGKPLPPVDPRLVNAWSEANKESTRSMYAFRKHYNWYDQKEPGQDWAGTKSELFTPDSVEARFKGASRGKPLNVQYPD